jgi:1,4-dihydroxy-2-naphthoate octaprenyltransferase
VLRAQDDVDEYAMRKRWLALLSPVILLALWEILARAGVIDQRFFSMPSEIFARLFELVQDGTLLTNTAITLRRVAVGFVLATVPLHVIVASLPIGFLVAAILHANNMRDLEGDLARNKRTLANIFGRRASQYEYLFLVGGSFVVLSLLVLTGYAPLLALLALLALLPLLVLPAAISLIRKAFATDEPQKLNRVLRATATLHGRFGWLMILGFAGALAGRLV